MSKSVSTPQLQACRTCEHGRKLYELRKAGSYSQCVKGHEPTFVHPEHEHDDQHGYHRNCEDWKCRADVIDADNMKVCDGCSEERTKDVHTTA